MMGLMHAQIDNEAARAAWDCLRRPIWLFCPASCRGIYANPSALALWGATSLVELLERDFSNLSQAVRTRTDRLRDLTANGQELEESWTFYPNGQPVTVRAAISSVRLDDGRDVLLFEAAPVEVEAEERRAIEALRHSAGPVGLFDGLGVPLFANPAAYAAYGTDASFLGRFVERASGEAILAHALEGHPSGALHAMKTQAGIRWHHVDCRPLSDPVTGSMSILLNERDVTDRVEAEAARAAAEQKAAMAEARQRFLTDMSHELRTPLNAVLGFAALLLKEDLTGSQSSHAARILSAGDELAGVVEQMIAGSVIDGTSLLGSTDPATVLSAISAGLKPDAARGDGEARPTGDDFAWGAAPGGLDADLASRDASGSDITACGAIADADVGIDGHEPRPVRVLYVDDNENNRALVSCLLATQGIECETADDGQQGLEVAMSGGWDVILMDIQMPVMDGVTAARCIRGLAGEAGAVPVIALTANTLDEQLMAYAEAGMNDCIGKPVKPAELFMKVAGWAGSGWREDWAAGAEALAA